MGMINKCQIWQGLLLLANIYTCIIFDCFKAFTIGDHFTSLVAILLLLAMDFYLMLQLVMLHIRSAINIAFCSSTEYRNHKQIDVLPSENQALCCRLNLLIYYHSMYCNDVTRTHHYKEHI